MGILRNPGDASYSALYNKCKHAAKQKDVKFCLTKEEHRFIIEQECHYCGDKGRQYNSYLKNSMSEQVRLNRYSANTIERNYIVINGIDRQDNLMGYTVDNSLPCCGMCNYLKCDMDYDEFLSWVKKAYNRLNRYFK